MIEELLLRGPPQARLPATFAQSASSQSHGTQTIALHETALAFQRRLAINPRDPQALVGMSVVALASRQHAAAVTMASAAITAAPAMGHAWVALGMALKAVNGNGGAEEAYLHAVRLDGMNHLARLGLGELCIANDEPEKAIVEFELALRRAPTLAGAHLGLGHALAMLGRNQDALAHYESTLALHSRLPDAEFAAAFVLTRLGRVTEAEVRYRRALVARPDFAAAWMNLGCLLRESGRERYAEAALRRAVELRPDLIAGWVNLAHLERERRHPILAENDLRKAFALNPAQVETHVAWCQFRIAERDFAGAWGWLRWALARAPNHAEALNMHGILLHAERRFTEAVAAFEKAEAAGHRAAASNRGNALLDLGRMDDALLAHESAVKRDPHHPGALYNLALTRLRLGDWQRGWPMYEARWTFREVHRSPRVFSQPRWHGEPLEGKSILLYAEQGLGDTIQFCRYATLAVARGGRVILEVQPAVERVLRSLPVVRAGYAIILPLGARLPAFDLECPLMSLPAVFATTVDTVPWPGAYLGPGETNIFNLSSQTSAPSFSSDKSALPLRVGLAWAGNPGYKGDRDRSVRLAALLPLLQTSDIAWISLQKGKPAQELPSLEKNIPIVDGSSNDRDLADTARLLATLDLVITTDTSIAHLAGAMARPVWILLPHLGDWRWMQSIETTPWYPTARLLRQPSPGDWASVIRRAATDLTALRETFRPSKIRTPPICPFLQLRL